MSKRETLAAVSKKKKLQPRKRSHPLEVVPIPVPEGSEHPPPPYGNGLLPVHEFTVNFLIYLIDGLDSPKR